jgi:hypothetical protein
MDSAGAMDIGGMQMGGSEMGAGMSGENAQKAPGDYQKPGENYKNRIGLFEALGIRNDGLLLGSDWW